MKCRWPRQESLPDCVKQAGNLDLELRKRLYYPCLAVRQALYYEANQFRDKKLKILNGSNKVNNDSDLLIFSCLQPEIYKHNKHPAPSYKKSSYILNLTSSPPNAISQYQLKPHSLFTLRPFGRLRALQLRKTQTNPSGPRRRLSPLLTSYFVILTSQLVILSITVSSHAHSLQKFSPQWLTAQRQKTYVRQASPPGQVNG